MIITAVAATAMLKAIPRLRYVNMRCICVCARMISNQKGAKIAGVANANNVPHPPRVATFLRISQSAIPAITNTTSADMNPGVFTQ